MGCTNRFSNPIYSIQYKHSKKFDGSFAKMNLLNHNIQKN